MVEFEFPKLIRHHIVEMLPENQISAASDAELLHSDPHFIHNHYTCIPVHIDELGETELKLVMPIGSGLNLLKQKQIPDELKVSQLNSKRAEFEKSRDELPLALDKSQLSVSASGRNTHKKLVKTSKKLEENAKESDSKACRKMSSHSSLRQGGHHGHPLAISLLFQLLLLQPNLVYSHYFPSTPSATQLTEWKPARATYYATADPRDTVGGACGYGDLEKNGYGKATAALSTSLFEKGQTCGACFELRCVEDLRWCIPGTSIIVTATNFCAPNYGFDANGGGKCNPPNTHFVLPIEAFEKIALWKASNMPVQYRRIRCRREGGVRFTIGGAGVFMSVLITNVAGGGDVAAVKIKGSRTGWLPMGRNWGQNWHINADLKKQPMSFELTSSDGVTITSYSVAPKDWEFGQSFEGKQFDS